MIIIVMIIVTAILVCVDQMIKIWAVGELAAKGISKPFIKFADTEIINLTYTENTGAAFGIMSDKQWFTIGVASVGLIAFTVYMLKCYNKSKFAMIVSAMVISGGIGNLIDRIRCGYVVDYLEVKIFDFAIFNFADVCVTVGVFLLVIYFLFFAESENEKSKIRRR
ncbi:MAG: signal peptidase II [Oscillospiraceae bacterium]|nr:signal peptidase II [Oscillospiraceae bacterium]